MKSKRVLTILLSMAIMLTFMPAMAFADVDAGIEPGSKPHKWVYNAEKSIPETCSTDGVAIETCAGENGLPCEAIRATFKDPTGVHIAKANPIQMSKDDLIKRLASEWGLGAEEVDALYKANADDCYAFVYECKECGKVPMTEDGDIDTDFVKWQGHKAPAGTPDCAMSYVCEFCGQTIKTTVTETSRRHDYSDWSTAQEFVCGDADAGYGYRVRTRTCSKCGNVRVEKKWRGGSNNVPESQAKHGKLEEYVVTPAKCEEDGVKAQRCTKCLEDVPFEKATDAVIPALKHDMATFTYDATCTENAYTYDRCSRCTLKNNYNTIPNSALGHKYNVEVIFEPNCDAEGVTRITCTNGCGYDRIANNLEVSSQTPSQYRHLRYVDSEGDVHSSYEAGRKIFFIGRNNEYYKNGKLLEGAIELADWHAKAHDWGQFEDMQAADCLHGAMQAAKCKVCGHYDAHTAVETGEPAGHKLVTKTQEPTCGAKGFTYDICSVCGAIKNAKQFGAPKVAYGTKCTFDKWVVEKEATPFAEGTKKLVCSVCGDDGHLLLEEVAGEFSVKEMGVTRASIAKTKIAAPKVKAGKKKATVTVKAVEGAVKYQIKVNGKVKKTVTKAGKVTIKKLKGGKKAKFQIVAFNDEGVKAASKVKTVKIKK